ncbi:hypothetical protein F4820DRAFT_243676 [Hypoxylon rubiginosum]|uniref:Uncharacterized protein n=1 Tax=Hypoxylon rubiginosum TaxID=110542 RepID=A0ACB9Z5C4_9PEZI|nr:hypothetical protein F4820DRAFT_243676 [Hypoxylon rubiginosum]
MTSVDGDDMGTLNQTTSCGSLRTVVTLNMFCAVTSLYRIVFGVLSVLLSAMQVALAAVPLIDASSGSWFDFALVSRGFSIFTLVVAAVIICYLLLDLITLVSRETVFALKDLYRKRRSNKRINKGTECLPTSS